MALIATRGAKGSVCPSEVARAIAPGPNWRSVMPAVHAAVNTLLDEDRVQLSWKGQPLAHRKGPYRISMRAKN